MVRVNNGVLYCWRIFLTPGQVFGSLITRAKPAKPGCIETWVLRVAGWLSFILC